MLKERLVMFASVLKAAVCAFGDDERGQGTMEYAVIVVVAVGVAVALGVVLTTMGQNAGEALSSFGASVFKTS